jgi:hypothetical protein
MQGLQYLVELELIKAKYQDKRRYYSFASDNMWIVNPVSIKSLVSSAVIDANNLMHCATKSDIRQLVRDWDTPRKRESLSVLIPGERERVETLIRDWEYEIGDSVVYIDSGVAGVVVERLLLTHSLNDNTYNIQSELGETNEAFEFDLKLKVSPVVEEKVEEEEDEVEIPSVLEV